MTRATSRTRRLLVSCIAATASIAVAAVLHARGLSFALTRTYFTFGPVHAQNAMGGMAKPAAPQSTGLAVTADGKSAAYSVAELNAMPQKTVKVHNEHAKADETYTGVALGDVLTKAGLRSQQANPARDAAQLYPRRRHGQVLGPLFAHRSRAERA